MDTNKDKNEFLNNLCKNSDSEDNEDVTWNQHDNFIDNQSSNALKNKQMNNVEQIQNSKGATTTTAASTSITTLPNQDDIIPAFKKMNIRETSANKSKQQRSKDLALNYYFGVGERQNNQNGNNEDPFENNNTKQQQQDATTYMQFNHNNFFQQNVTQQQQQQSSSLQMNTNNTTTNNTSQQLEQELLNEQQHQQPQSNFTSLFNVNDNNNNNNNTTNNNNNSQRGDTSSLIEKYNVNSQPYIPKNKDLNYYKNAQLQPSQHQLLPNTNVDNQLYKLNLSKSSNIPGKFYVIKSVDEANVIRSISFNIWCSTIKGNQKLQKAFKESAQKYPIYLFFSVNGSGKFMGLAQMVSEVEYRVNFNYWSQNDKWKGFFFIRWLYIKDIPNKMFRNIINEYNDNKPVTSSRDTQEIFPSAGIEMYKIFKEYPQETSIFDQLTMEEKMAIMQSQQQGQMPNQMQQQHQQHQHQHQHMQLQANQAMNMNNMNKQQQGNNMYSKLQQQYQQKQQQGMRSGNGNGSSNNMYLNQMNMNMQMEMLNQMNMNMNNNRPSAMNNNPRMNHPMNINMGFGNINLQTEKQLVNQIPLMMQQLQKQQEQFQKMNNMMGLNFQNPNNINPNNPTNTNILGNISNNSNNNN